MENITLYRKYRPQNFNQLYGQEHIVEAIKNSLDNNKMSHAYLFNGPRGVGKTTIARLIAKGINCLNNGPSSIPCDECDNCKEIVNGSSIDIIEIDAASNRGIDEIRDLKESTGYLPVKCRKKIYIIDEVHMLTKEAFNALLKILEEPPQHILFILATTEIEKIPDTVISRCQRYDFKTLSKQNIVEMLKSVAEKENIKIDEESLNLIYQKSEGSARDSFSIFEQVISNYYHLDEITLELTEKALGLVSSMIHKEFLENIKEAKKEKIIEQIDELWNNGIQIDQFLKDFCRYIKMSDTDIDLKIKIISNIYDLLNKFRNEEDKRLISYLIINKILKKEKEIVVSQVVKYNEKKNIPLKQFNEDNWNEFISYLEKEGRYKFYCLLNQTSVNIENNNISISVNNKGLINVLNNPNTIDFIEKSIYDKYGINVNLIPEKIEETNFLDENIKNRLISVFDAVEV